jgi:hypothetical protein
VKPIRKAGEKKAKEDLQVVGITVRFAVGG